MTSAVLDARARQCTACQGWFGSYARRARCVFGCGAWYCRRRTPNQCAETHARSCPALTPTSQDSHTSNTAPSHA
jgi:hypothetical protein